MYKKIINIANKLDKKGYYKTADKLDKIIVKIAEIPKEQALGYTLLHDQKASVINLLRRVWSPYMSMMGAGAQQLMESFRPSDQAMYAQNHGDMDAIPREQLAYAIKYNPQFEKFRQQFMQTYKNLLATMPTTGGVAPYITQQGPGGQLSSPIPQSILQK